MAGVGTLSVLLAGTIFLVAVSWRSLRHPGSHGFFRFFAFEAIFCIVVLNAPVWSRRPFAPLQLLSWPLLIVSLGLAVHGFHLLRRLGQPSEPEPGSPMFRIENTTALVTVGAYRWIRHPLYASLLCLAWESDHPGSSMPAVREQRTPLTSSSRPAGDSAFCNSAKSWP